VGSADVRLADGWGTTATTHIPRLWIWPIMCLVGR